MSDIAQASVRQQLQMLKEQTRLTGALHEAQVLQLKNWPLVVFQDASGSEFTWDPDKKYVAFVVKIPPRCPSRLRSEAWWKKRVGALNQWVQELLGDEWYIKVRVGKKNYSGARSIRSMAVRKAKVTDAGHDAGTEGGPAH